jgi:methyl-accepting chemotaxis protein
MIGMVVSTWIKTCTKIYGQTIIDNALKEVNWNSSKKFKPLEIVDDSVINKFIISISKSTNHSEKKIWSDIGSDNLKVFSKNFPLFFVHDNLYGFLKSLNSIHKNIVDRMPSAIPPTISIEVIPTGRKEALFTYTSKRAMFDYMLSMLKASAEHFKEDLKIEVLENTNDTMKLKLTFENDIYYKKKYILNKVLSLGFIKKLEVKVGIIMLISLLLSHAFFKYIFSSISIPFAEELIGTVVASIFVGLLVSPANLLKKQLHNILNKNYIEDIHIETNDVFQDMSKTVRQIAQNFSDTIISTESITDEISEFNNDFKNRLENSYSIFKEITSAINEVTEGACQQSSDSEATVKILNENTTALNNIVSSQSNSQDKLKEVVDEIKANQTYIEASASSLESVTEKFSELNLMSSELKSEVNEILNIVSAVTSIAEETSLLSLNASIEAARAGEAGKGFSVVAKEIGKLSSNSKSAAEEISNSLNTFINKISLLTEKIDNQYIILSKENDKLINVANSSALSVNSIDKVLAEIIAVILSVTKETNEIQKVFEKIESLVAIGEENAAMAEEVNSSVSSYSTEVEDIINVMRDLKNITDKFSNTLSQYKI